MYQKETNKYQFLHPLSNHPPHVIRNWITEESRRIRNRCSRTLDADLNIIRFQARLANRGYGWPTIDYLTSVDRLADFVTHPKSGNLQFKGRQQTVFNLIVRLPDTVKCIPWESIKSIPLNVLDMFREQLNDYRRTIRLVKINGPSISRLLIRSKFVRPRLTTYEDIQDETANK